MIKTFLYSIVLFLLRKRLPYTFQEDSKIVKYIIEKRNIFNLSILGIKLWKMMVKDNVSFNLCYINRFLKPLLIIDL